MFTIGALSRQTGVKITTIRYYEQIGLLEAAGRSAGNQRRYSDVETERLTFIRHARGLGLPLDAIRALIRLSQHPEQSCADADRIAAEQLTEVRQRIARLQRLETELDRISKGCDGTLAKDCAVIRALADHSQCQGEH